EVSEAFSAPREVEVLQVLDGYKQAAILGDQVITWKSSTLFLGVTATPSARSRWICLRPTAPSLVGLPTPFAATTRNQGIRSDTWTVRVARMKAPWRAVTCRC